MKKSQLKELIKEEIRKVLKEIDEKEFNKIESYLDSHKFKYNEDQDAVYYDINGNILVMGISHRGHYCLDDKTNTRFNSLEDILKFYNIKAPLSN
jgi:hypothetical protein